MKTASEFYNTIMKFSTYLQIQLANLMQIWGLELVLNGFYV